jgi:hypothetical protein
MTTIASIPIKKTPVQKPDNGKKITRELTLAEEKAAFLYTSRINSAKIIAKHLI